MFKKSSARAGFVGYAVGHALSSTNVEDRLYRRLVKIAYISYYEEKTEKERLNLISKISSLNESQILGSFVIVNYMVRLLDGETPIKAYREIRYDNYIWFSEEARKDYDWLLQRKLETETSINPSESNALKAILWCLLTTENFKDAVLESIAMKNTSIGAITGAIAGIIYGLETIPTSWREEIAENKVIAVSDRFVMAI